MGMIDRVLVAKDEAYKRELRLKSQTDVLFLARLLGYDKLLDRVHGPAIEKCCVKKDPRKPIEEQSSIKDRLHLDPRGTFKSTISIVDSSQWIVGFPNVRICKITATKPLAAAIVDEICGHFVKSVEAEPTDFQLLFPEFCITPREKRVGIFTVPCRTREWREATVMAFSIETSISGWHFDVFDPDDPVDTQNSKTPEGIANVKKNYRINRKTLMPWGYVHFKGTRYNPFDLWGDIIDKAKPGKTLTLIRSALVLKNGARLEPGDFPERGDVELLFPELLSYDYLKDQFEDDYSSFMTQYMNDAQGGNEVTFSKEAILQAGIPHEQVPITGEVFLAFRYAYKGKPQLKNSAGTVGILANGRMYVVEAFRGSFRPSAFAHRIALLAKKYGSHNVTIEETPGVRHLESAILNYALTMGWPLSITWLPYQEDDGARDIRIKAQEPLIVSMRLLFSDSIKEAKQLSNQYTNYGMIEDIEIPDVISRIVEKMPQSIVPVEQDGEQDLAWELAKQRDVFDRTHGLGQYAAVERVEEEAPYEAPTNDYGLDDMLGGLNG